MPEPAVLVVQSTRPVTAAALPGNYATGITVVDLDRRLAALTSGQHVNWSLIGNTAVCRSPRGPDGRAVGRGRRTPLPPERRDDWARRKLVGALDVDAIDGAPLAAGVGRRGRGGGTVTHARHRFSGTGSIVDAAALRDLARSGVGAGKAFGCGLLIVSPA